MDKLFRTHSLSDPAVVCKKNLKSDTCIKQQVKQMAQNPSYDELKRQVDQLKSDLRKNEPFNGAYNCWQTTFDSVNDAMWILDQSWSIVHANQATFRLLGIPHDKVIGRKCYEVIHGLTEPIAACPVRKLETTLKRQMEEIALGDRQYEIIVDPIIGSDGGFNGVVHMLSDITQRKQVEQALKVSQKRFSTIFNANPVAIAITNLETNRLIEVNKAWERITGYSCKEVVGQTTYDIALWVDSEQRKQMIAELKAGGKAKDEVRIRKKSGDIRHVLMSAEIIHLAGAPYLISIGLDISEKKQLEAQLRQVQKMESIGILAGGIAHDFNNILTSIIGFTQLAFADIGDPQAVKDDLHEIYSAGMRAKELVRQILTFARQVDEKVAPIQVDSIAKEAIKFIRSSIPTSVEIRATIKSGAMIMGSATHLHQIFMNLFSNSAHAMEKDGGELNVTLSNVKLGEKDSDRHLGLPSGEYIQITVSDTGEGIPEEILDSIFDPYFTTKAVGEGTGMGLSVVHGIVEQYGGKIVVKSEIGKGTAFIVYLPMIKTKKPTPPQNDVSLPLGNESILVVDDEPSVAQMWGRILEQLGYQVSVMSDSVAALDLFKSEPDAFDLIISDVAMPKMSGDQLAMAVKKIRPDIPVIICTGYSKRITEDEALDMGITAFLYKPIARNEMAQVVRKALDAVKPKPSM